METPVSVWDKSRGEAVTWAVVVCHTWGRGVAFPVPWLVCRVMGMGRDGLCNALAPVRVGAGQQCVCVSSQGPRPGVPAWPALRCSPGVQ